MINSEMTAQHPLSQVIRVVVAENGVREYD
jgi:hypothetical protein